ncbi:MAG: hypothetical protein R3E79_60065 [Caldilineaceae bacterium]
MTIAVMRSDPCLTFDAARRGRPGAAATPINTSINWRRLLTYLRPYRRRMALAIGALAIAGLLGLSFPLVIVQLLDSVLQQQDQRQLTNLTLGLVGIFFLQASVYLFSELQLKLYWRKYYS